MIMQFFEIHPTDTLFFRDSRPFNKDETITLAGVKSIFPPSPATVAGAIMVTYAKVLGWDGSSPWGKSIEDKLNNTDKPLIFSGIFLRKEGKVLFPAPQHLIELRSKDACQHTEKNRKFNELHELGFLTPSKNPYKTDMGAVYLPEVENQPKETVIKPLDGYWITKEGLASCLKLKIPEKNTLYHQSELWKFESKIGIERDLDTHATKQGALYSSTHIRLCADVSIIIGVENLPNKDFQESPINIDNKLMILGGEARTASMTKIDINIDNLTTQMAINNLTPQTEYLIYIASPTPVADPQAIPNIKTACMPRQMRIGGWNSLKFEPLPLTPFLTPGTVLFMQNPVNKGWEKSLTPEQFTQINSVYGYYFFGENNNDNEK